MRKLVHLFACPCETIHWYLTTFCSQTLGCHRRAEQKTIRDWPRRAHNNHYPAKFPGRQAAFWRGTHGDVDHSERGAVIDTHRSEVRCVTYSEMVVFKITLATWWFLPRFVLGSTKKYNRNVDEFGCLLFISWWYFIYFYWLHSGPC